MQQSPAPDYRSVLEQTYREQREELDQLFALLVDTHDRVEKLSREHDALGAALETINSATNRAVPDHGSREIPYGQRPPVHAIFNVAVPTQTSFTVASDEPDDFAGRHWTERDVQYLMTVVERWPDTRISAPEWTAVAATLRRTVQGVYNKYRETLARQGHYAEQKPTRRKRRVSLTGQPHAWQREELQEIFAVVSGFPDPDNLQHPGYVDLAARYNVSVGALRHQYLKACKQQQAS